MNAHAYTKMLLAESEYLRENGWVPVSDDMWQNAKFKPYPVRGGHAVNIQKQYDRAMVRACALVRSF